MEILIHLGNFLFARLSALVPFSLSFLFFFCPPPFLVVRALRRAYVRDILARGTAFLILSSLRFDLTQLLTPASQVSSVFIFSFFLSSSFPAYAEHIIQRNEFRFLHTRGLCTCGPVRKAPARLTRACRRSFNVCSG